jgi:uncharacterized protein YjbI with pentapeptide repeats
MGGCAFTVAPGERDDIDGLDGEWACPHPSHDGTERCVFHLPEAERDGEVDGRTLREAFDGVLGGETRDEKRLLCASIDRIDLDHLVLDAKNRFPLDLRGADIGELSLSHVDSEIALDLRGATVDHLDMDNAELEEEFTAAGARFGSIDAYEAEFDRGADFSGATFTGEVDFDEAEFDDEVHFRDATFEGPTRFRGTAFHGVSNLLDDNTSFAGATFADEVTFEQARFEATTFEDATFAEAVNLQEATFAGDTAFRGATFEGFADIDEAQFEGDTTFEGARFERDVDFRGASFLGSNRVLEADVSFADAEFDAEADFRHAHFRGAEFSGARFTGRAMFQESDYGADSSFAEVAFESRADFDETRFDGDADFSEASFAAPADFRGAEFVGQANYLEDNATFEGARFASMANFDSARFTTVNFRDVRFGGEADFAESIISDRAEFDLAAPDRDVVVDLTEVEFPEGFIRQPADQEEWVAYDLTRATVGDLRLEAAEAGGRDLLRSVRFCETEFDGFDFSAHRRALEEADWTLHEFTGPGDYTPSREMNPRAIELTYLKAANAAKSQGDRDAGVEFSIKKAHHRRYKNLELVNDPSLPAGRRFTKGTEVIGNYAWHSACGYGYRLWRILAASIVVVVTWGLLYALLPLFDAGSGTTEKIAGITELSQLSTVGGLKIVVDNVYFSLVTFTTVGYGDVNPLGWAKILAAIEGALGVLLASLVVFVLGRRVAI